MMADNVALRYAGLMGHRYCVVGTVDNERRIVGEADTETDARKLAAGHEAVVRPVIYKRLDGGKPVVYQAI